MKVVPTIHIDLRSQSARQMLNVSLATLSDAEIKFLMETFARAEGGSFVEFTVGQTEDGRQCMQFTIGKTPEVEHAAP